jgi:hypothetical protein
MFNQRIIRFSAVKLSLVFLTIIFLLWISPWFYGFVFPRYILQSNRCTTESCPNCGLPSYPVNNTTTTPQCYIIAFSFCGLLLFTGIIVFSIFHWIYLFFCYSMEEKST